MDDDKRGVHVSLEGDIVEDENRNFLSKIIIKKGEIEIFSTFSKYIIDISQINQTEIDEMMNLLRKQNHDNRFTIQRMQSDAAEPRR